MNTVGFIQINSYVVSEVIRACDPMHIAKGFVEVTPTIMEINKRGTISASLIYGPSLIDIKLQEIVFKAIKPGT